MKRLWKYLTARRRFRSSLLRLRRRIAERPQNRWDMSEEEHGNWERYCDRIGRHRERLNRIARKLNGHDAALAVPAHTHMPRRIIAITETLGIVLVCSVRGEGGQR